MSKKCAPLWCEAHFEVKMYKTPHVRATFGSSDVEKVHAVVARSIFRSENVQNTTCSRHFWKFRCGKSARRCGAKMREAHVEVKMYKTPHVRGTFGYFWRFRCRFAWQAPGIVHYSRISKTKGLERERERERDTESSALVALARVHVCP